MEQADGPARAGRGGAQLPGRVVTRESADLAIDALLADLFLHATNCVRSFGDFHLAVSASPEVDPALMRMMYDPGYRDFPWARTRIWMIDELDVAADDPQRRWTRISDTIVACSGIPLDQCHMLAPTDDVAAYQQLIRGHLEWRERGQDRIDCCLFAADGAQGIGALNESPPGVGRIRIDPQFVRGARLLSVLVGEAPVQTVEGLARWARASRAVLAPVGGDLIWYVGTGPAGDIALV